MARLMKFGVNTLIWSISFNPDVVPWDKLTAAGVDGIESPVFAPAEFPVAEFRRCLADNGLAATVCSICPPDGMPGSEDAAERQRALDHWKAAIAVAGEVGAEVLAGPSCSPVGHLQWVHEDRSSPTSVHAELSATLRFIARELCPVAMIRFTQRIMPCSSTL